MWSLFIQICHFRRELQRPRPSGINNIHIKSQRIKMSTVEKALNRSTQVHTSRQRILITHIDIYSASFIFKSMMLKTWPGEVDPQEKLVEPMTPRRLTMNPLHTQKTTNQTDSMEMGDNNNKKDRRQNKYYPQKVQKLKTK